MTEFTDLELTKDVSDMSEEEAKETLTDFMKSHQENRSAYDSLQTEFDETVEEKVERIEDLEERISEFTEEKAEEAAEYVNMPSDLIADRFDYSEIEKIIEEAEESTEFSEDEDSDDADEETDESLTSFSERDEKGRFDGDNRSEYRERAKDRLKNHGFPTE